MSLDSSTAGFVPGSVPLTNPRHEEFAQKIAQGGQVTKTYQSMYKGIKVAAAQASASRLRHATHVARRILFLQNKAAEHVAMERGEFLAFLEDAVRTPIDEINESHPLCVEKTVGPSGDVIKYKSLSKQAALDMIAKAKGFYQYAIETEGESYRTPSEVAQEIGTVALKLHGRADDVAEVIKQLSSKSPTE